MQIWKRIKPTPPTFDATIISHGTAFINAIAYLPPSSAYPKGLVVSGGKDAIIEARQPDKTPTDDAEALMPGHANNVCALDVSSDGDYIVSGSWDAKAKVWRIGKWECDAVLEDHGGSVWAVLAYNKNTVITGKPSYQVDDRVSN